jgi:hypothetical protein
MAKKMTAPRSATNHSKGQSGFPPNNKVILDLDLTFTIREGRSLNVRLNEKNQ